MSEPLIRASGPQPNSSTIDKGFVKPSSGGLVSFAAGSLMAVASLIAFGEFSIATNLSASKGRKAKPMTTTEVTWSPPPALPVHFNEKRFVEANSEVPENPPDETSNFSFRDQQAAQPKPSVSAVTDDTPEVKGEKATTKIAPSAEQSKPSLTPPDQASKKSLTSQENNLPPKKAVSSKTEVEEGESENGIQLKKNEKDGDKSKTVLLAKSFEQSSTRRTDSNLSPPIHKPRPKLSPELIRGPLMKSSTTAHRIGSVAIECRLHPYGVYLQEMLKAIEEQWHQLATGSIRFLQKDRVPGTVTYRFTLLPTGKIERLTRLDTGKSSLPSELCRQAIASRVPFGIWTDEMIKDFGQSDEVTISFRYR